MKYRAKKILFLILGFLSLAIGIIGIFIPLLPTTPLLLLAAASFMRSSEKLYDWLLNHRWFGDTIRNFREYRAIRLRTKIFAVGLLWFTILTSVILVVSQLWIRIFLLTIAVIVSVHILHFDTLKDSKD
jgi:uncharacterized membrane protein YbaN (DUF454 family)